MFFERAIKNSNISKAWKQTNMFYMWCKVFTCQWNQLLVHILQFDLFTGIIAAARSARCRRGCTAVFSYVTNLDIDFKDKECKKMLISC